MSQLINEPTRITKSGSTLIDVILSSHPHNISLAKVIQLGISDHFMVGSGSENEIVKVPKNAAVTQSTTKTILIKASRWPLEIRY